MTIILFLVDTSSSMCQRAHVNGVQKTYLDIAKGAVETFLKYRQRSQDCMGDRYMLLTFEDPPCNVKAGWKENHATFINELKNLQSNGLTSMGEALKNAFDLLNLNRMQSGIDTYGQGRCPFYLEPSVIIVITDGGKYSFRNGVHLDITLPLHAQIPGTKFTKEPFRWDQRLFSLVLRMAGNKLDERAEGKVPHDDSPIEKMCEVTGGRSYRVKSHYVLNQCIESLVQKVQPGVVVHFEQLLSKDLKDGEVQDIALQTTKKMIYVHKHPSQKTFPVGYWPIPEPYWPDQKAVNLPPRDAHPKIKILTPCMDEPQTVRNFPIDKYELEASPLTLQILSKRDPTKCWSVVVSNGADQPFGYLKANNTYTQVYLMVLPYNFPILLPLLNELYQKYNLSPPTDWIYKFTTYVRSIPQYYCPFLRRALVTSNVPYPLLQYILPENLDGYLSPAVANYLKQMKNTAKVDQDALCMRVFKQLKLPKPPYHPIETTKLHCGQPLKRDLVTHPMLKETFTKLHSDINTYENYTIVVPSIFSSGGGNGNSTKNYRNPFDIPRADLIDEVARMRENFFRYPIGSLSMITKDAGHSLPIAEMGNYQEYLKNKEPPLREIEPTNVRQHMFGNPYKKDKNMVMVDEADLGDVMNPMRNQQNSMNPVVPITPASPTKKGEITKSLVVIASARKRKAGPIRKDFTFRRLSTGSLSSSASSTSSVRSDTSSIVSNENIANDFDDDSETGSNMSDDGDDNRLFVDFNEPSVADDFSINNDIQDFINGKDSIDDVDDDDDVLMSLHNVVTTPLVISSPIVIPTIPIIQQQLLPPIITVTTQSPIISPSSLVTSTSSISSPLQLVSNFNNITATTTISTATILSPPIITIASSSYNQNDINDATEISKILQQCHNGNSSNVDHHHNQNHLIKPEIKEDTIDQMMNNIENIEPTSNNTIKIKTEDLNGSVNDNGNNLDDDDLLNEQETDTMSSEQLDEIRENIKKGNIQIRTIVYKDIRRPGRNYSLLLDHLHLFKGDFGTRFSCIQMCINESLRFRRRKMADSIQDWWEKQIDETLNT